MQASPLPRRLLSATGLSLVALLGLCGAAGADVVLLRDGSHRAGALAACAGEQCRIGGRTIARAEIAWIGLGVDEPPAPAPPADPGRDEVRLRDGSAHAGRLVGVSLGTVVSERGSWDREDVGWIYLAPEREAEPEQPLGAQEIEEPEPPEPTVSPPDPPPVEETVDPPPERTVDPPPRRPRPPQDPVRPCPAGQPLGAEVEILIRGVVPQQWRRDETLRVWFRLAPDAPPDGRLPASYVLAGDMWWQAEATACTDLPGTEGFAAEVCSCRSSRAEGRDREPGGHDDRGRFDALEPELTFLVPEPARDALSVELECVTPTGRSLGSTGFSFLHRYDISPDCESDVCTAAGPCSGATADRSCRQRPELHAVIPFAGEGHVPGAPADAARESVTWRVCCGCGEPPRGPPPEFDERPPESDPCHDAAERFAAMVQRLRAARETYELFERDLRCASASRDAARDSIWGASGSLAKLSNALLGLAAEGVEGALGTLLGLLSTNVALLQQPGQAAQVDAVIELATSDEALSMAEREILRQAWTQANQYLLDHPDDVAGAARILRQQTTLVQGGKGLAKAISLLAAMKGFQDAAGELCRDLSRYAAWREEADREQAGMDQASRQLDAHLAAIEELRSRCPEVGPPPPRPPDDGAARQPCPAHAMPQGEPDAPCSLPLPGGTEAAEGSPDAAAASGAAGDAGEADGAAEAMGEIAAVAQRVEQRAAAELLPRLVPFLIDETDEEDLPLARHLLAGLAPHLEATLADLRRARQIGGAAQAAAGEAERPP